MLQHFHSRTLVYQASCVFPKLSSNDVRIITQTILESCRTEKIASLIAHSLVDYLRVRQTQMISLRATPVHLFNREKSWWIVEWTECDETNVIVIFHFEEEPEQGSWLMHSGQVASTEDTPLRRWKKSRIDWNVANVQHLKTLFNVTQHMLGLLEWRFANTLEQLCQKKGVILTEYIFP
jgi:hypothetical protein